MVKNQRRLARSTEREIQHCSEVIRFTNPAFVGERVERIVAAWGELVIVRARN